MLAFCPFEIELSSPKACVVSVVLINGLAEKYLPARLLALRINSRAVFPGQTLHIAFLSSSYSAIELRSKLPSRGIYCLGERGCKRWLSVRDFSWSSSLTSSRPRSRSVHETLLSTPGQWILLDFHKCPLTQTGDRLQQARGRC